MPRRRRAPAPQTVDALPMPPPMGGLNSISAGSAMPPTDCLRLYNMVPAEQGLRARLGSREWCTGLTGAADNYVRSVHAFTGSAKNGATNRLYAMTSSGIWDVTSSSAAPTRVLDFVAATGDAGYGYSTVMTAAGGNYLLYCDEVNGYHVYSEATGSWTAVPMGTSAGQVSGVSPASLVHVTVFKSRVWFTERDSGSAWYLPAGAVFGAATAFPMGREFRTGGPLVGLYNWTYDGGSGLDDSLVGISNGGDVVIYQGTDPANDFAKRGTWQVGAPPDGRDLVVSVGGDPWLLTRFGLQPLSQLVVGANAEVARSQLPTAKVASLFTGIMQSRASRKGWALRLHPEDGTLLVMVPTNEGQATEQLVMALANRSWSSYRDLPILSSAVLAGKLYYGTVDGKVGIHDGYVDGITLADPSSYTPVQWALLTSFQSLGTARQKQVEMVRPTFLTDGSQPAYRVEARYRYNAMEVAPVSQGPASGSVWDSATWDSAVWGGDLLATQSLNGTTGMGVDVAIAMRGTAIARTTLVGMDVFVTQGGLL
jgi:hypothetical protein